eukprot:SAG11_NODE_957_length_6394_cov_4.145512_1_plen_345_part_00
MLISAAIPTIPGLVGVDISRNQMISADVAPVLIESIQKSNIENLVIGKSVSIAVGGSDATSLDYSDQDLGPGEVMLISALVIPTTPGVVEVVISQNKCFGTKNGRQTGRTSWDQIHDVDKNQSGWSALCKAMEGSTIQKLGFADIGLGPVGMRTLAETIHTIPWLVGVDISRNQISADVAPTLIESIQKSNVETLVIGKSSSIAIGGSDATSLDCSDQDLGPGEIMLISALVIPTTPGLVGVDISRNQLISADAAPMLIESVQKSNIKTLVVGKSASLAVGGSDATSLDYSNQDLGPGEIMLISSLVIPTTPGLIELVLSDNPSIVEADLDLLKQAASCVTITV